MEKWSSSKKFKIELLYDPTTSPSGYNRSKGNKHRLLKRYMRLMFIVVLFTVAKVSKQPVFINGWMDKEDVILYNEILFSREKKGDSAICDNKWMLMTLA